MPQGVECYLSEWKMLFFGIHCFVGYNSLLIIPAQYKYRYSFVRASTNDKRVLF